MLPGNGPGEWTKSVPETRGTKQPVMFEAEITYVADASVTLPGTFAGTAVYHDVYFDSPDGAFYASGRELRLRSVSGRTVLTGKPPPFDAATGSKEEHETAVADGATMWTILEHLGFVARLAFAKTCSRYMAVHTGLPLDITVVTVDFSPETFVEIEHLAATPEAAKAALPVIRHFAAGLGLTRLRPACYTDLFLASRGLVPASPAPAQTDP
jgi:adenylate cyclase, class 2